MLKLGQHLGFWLKRRSNITYKSKTSNFSNGASVTSITINKPSGVAANQLLVAVIVHEGNATSLVSASGWTFHSRIIYGSILTILYRWTDSSDLTATNYTFSHSDGSNGGMGGGILYFEDSAVFGQSPIVSWNDVKTYFIASNTADLTWNTNELGIDIQGAICLAVGGCYRVPSAGSLPGLYINTTNYYTDIFGVNPIGGYSSGTGNVCGGGVGVLKFSDIGTALDAGSGIYGESGSPTGSWWHYGRLFMMI